MLRTRASRGGRRFRDTLVALEVALALVLLCGAAVTVRGLYRMVTADPGFDARHVLTLSVAVPGRPSEETSRRTLAALETLPGVEAAAVAFPLPFGHGWSGNAFQPEGHSSPEGGRYAEARIHYVSPGYFRTLGMRLLQGRVFSPTEEAKAAVVNENFARDSWPGADPLGRRFRMGFPVPDSPWVTVVGVVANTKENGLDIGRIPEIYMPISYSADMLVRTAGEPLAMASAIRARIRDVDRGQAVYDIIPLEERIRESVRTERAIAFLSAVFAGLALVLAVVGIYGVVSHAVSQRTQELGVRIALGAQPVDVRRLVLRQGMLPVAVGIALGIPGAHAAVRLIGSLLFGVKPAETSTFIAVAALLAIAALLACHVPARRGTRIDPIEALRYE